MTLEEIQVEVERRFAASCKEYYTHPAVLPVPIRSRSEIQREMKALRAILAILEDYLL